MPERLIIRQQSSADTWEWVVMAANQATLLHQGSGSLAEISAQARNREIIVLLPSQNFRLTSTNIPSTSINHLSKAIPFALEDELSTDIESCHFAFNSIGPNKQAVLIAQTKFLQELLEQLQQATIQADKLYPDVFALPSEYHTWHILFLDDIALVRCGDYQGFAVDHDNLNLILTSCLHDSAYPKPEKIVLHQENAIAFQLEDPAFSDIEILTDTLTTTRIAWLADEIIRQPHINLLQGEFRQTQKTSRTQRYWRIASSLTALWLIIFTLSHIAEYSMLKYQTERKQQEITALYKQAFPTASGIVSPRLRFERKLQQMQQAQSGGAFLLLLAKAVPLLKQQNVTIKTMSFRNNDLQLDINMSDFQALQRLVTALKAIPLNVKQTNAKRGDKFITATLIIRKVS